MASKNETFSDVIDEFGKKIELMRKCKCVGVSLWSCLKFKLRIELAHKRELEYQAVHNCELRAKSGLCGLNDEIKKHRHEVMELRECLKEMIDYICGACPEIVIHDKCDDSSCTCFKWRKALEGGAK